MQVFRWGKQIRHRSRGHRLSITDNKEEAGGHVIAVDGHEIFLTEASFKQLAGLLTAYYSPDKEHNCPLSPLAS
jgi:hypothetical protein